MRKDKGLNGDIDRLPMLTWVMFLKFLDDLEHIHEQKAALAGKPYGHGTSGDVQEAVSRSQPEDHAFVRRATVQRRAVEIALGVPDQTGNGIGPFRGRECVQHR
jgi:hypothetical protein